MIADIWDLRRRSGTQLGLMTIARTYDMGNDA
jgi:hypothetical protein